MARKGIFDDLATATAKKPAPKPMSFSGAARTLVDSVEELASRSGTIDLDPNLVDPSPFPDRLPDDDSKDFEALKRSIAEDGQKVPVQVRAHPLFPGRYQIVYGHRRLRAAMELGQPLKAIKVELSDADLVMAQGIENGARQDLTWIERALFAKRMEDAGTKPRDIKAALLIDDANLSLMRTVYTAVPEDVIQRIGRAPKIGRPRWIDLAKAIAGRVDEVRQTFSVEKVSDSNLRFQMVLDALKPKIKKSVQELDIKISAATRRGKAFAKFVESRLPALMAEFEKGEH
jgi:ParB family chromosome partitioning protein